MKRTILIMAFFIVLAVAVLGCLTIFEVINPTEAGSFFAKFSAAIMLIGFCSILVTMLMNSKSDS